MEGQEPRRNGAFPTTRRDLMLATAGLPLLGGIAGAEHDDEDAEVDVAKDRDYAGWVLQYMNTGEYEQIQTGITTYEGVAKSFHLLDYMTSKWVDFGNPLPDEAGGCWQHTFRLTSLGISLETLGEATPGAGSAGDTYFSENVLSVESETNAEAIAVAPRRDPDLYGFIGDSFLIDEHGNPRQPIVDATKELSDDPDPQTVDLRKIHAEVVQDAETVDNITSTAATLFAWGIGNLVARSPAGDLAELAAELGFSSLLDFSDHVLNDRPDDVEEIGIDEGFGHTLSRLGPSTGHITTFDVYVAPGETGTIKVTSAYPVETTQIELDPYQDSVEWEINFDSPPESADVADLDARRILNARPVSEDGYVITDSQRVARKPSETNVPLELWRKGKPRPHIDVNVLSEFPTGRDVTFDADKSTAPHPDAELSYGSYDWEVSNTDGYGFDTGSGVTFSPEFGECGEYEVTLEVEDSLGLSRQITKTHLISELPSAELSVTPSSVTAGESVTVDARDSTVPPECDFTYELAVWRDSDELDVTLEEELLTDVVLEQPGTYTFELRVTNPYNVRDIAREVVEVDVGVSIEGAQSTTQWESESYSANVDGDIGGREYYWSGPNGGGIGPSHSITFEEPGSFEVSVFVDGETASGSDSVTVDVEEVDPVSVSIDGPQSTTLGATESYSATVEGGHGGREYYWSGPDGGGTGPSNSVTFDEPGSFEISVTVVDDTGSDSASMDVYVEANEISVSIDGPSYTTKGETESFSADVEGGYGRREYYWSGPDGGGTGPYNSVTFDETGTFEVSVTVVDDTGSDSASKSVYVDDRWGLSYR